MSCPPPYPEFDQRRSSWADSSSRRPTDNAQGERPTILIVTPEITYLPKGMGNLSQRMRAKAGGLADVSASLVRALYEQGADVHVALPNYRRMYNLDAQSVFELEYEKVARSLPRQRIHLAEDRVFYHRDAVYAEENRTLALAFQREVINHTIPQVRPQLIHCNDWMTGLIPAVAKRFGIPSLITIHNIHTERVTLAQIEDRGIDAADFWQHLYFQRSPGSYEETREHNPTDLLTSGIFAADFVNSVSPTFLNEVIHGHHDFVPAHIRHELWAKANAGCASGILNAPDTTFDPATDEYLDIHFGPDDHAEGKRANKVAFQEKVGLDVNPDAPLFYWPSRLDPVQKGCQLLTDILYQLVADYADEQLQIAVVANGAYQDDFHRIVGMHGIGNRVAVTDFNEGLSHQAYASADFIFMPSSFEPCGLPQMVSPKYGTLTVAHDTGGLHDTVEHLDVEANTGNGFLFQHFDSIGLRWACDEAMRFYHHPAEVRFRTLSRIMKESAERFNHETTASDYIKLYERMLQRPVTAQ